MPKATDEYWENLFRGAAGMGGAAEVGTGAAAVGGLSKIKKFLGGKGAKAGIGSMIAWMALDRLLSEGNKAAERRVQREALQGQAAMATPENLYYQAALPTAQAEEEQARQALFSQISGGVLGPQLARGERLI